jgi:hypothetical protein
MTQTPAVLHECCASCKFWKRPAIGASDCRRMPPNYSLASKNCRLWPNTLGTDWCGEWKALANGKAPKSAAAGSGPALG